MLLQRQPSEVDEKIAILNLKGDCNTADCPALLAEVESVLKSGRAFIMVQLEDVDSMASTFIGTMMECRAILKAKGGNIVLIGPVGSIRDRLEGLGADKIFPIYPDAHVAYNRYHWDYSNITQSLNMTFPPRLKDVPAVRVLISDIAKQKGYSAKDIFRIETIVDEITNNAIEHGEQSQTEINLEFFIDKKKIELLVKNKTHQAKANNLRQIIELSSKSHQHEGIFGHGLALVKLISNAINVSVDNTGTYVKVTKFKEAEQS